MRKNRLYKMPQFIGYEIKQYCKQDDGVSLIEAAFALIMIGLIILPILQASRYETRLAQSSVTHGSLAGLQGGINNYFLGGAGAYPCPSDLDTAPGDNGYGRADDCSDLSQIPLCNDPLWFEDDGICKTSDNIGAVIIGGAPFATLKMNEEAAFDYWGNKVLYAVTHTQTNNDTYTIGAGQVRAMVVDSPTSPSNDGNPRLLDTQYDFILFSTGAGGVGGVTRMGQRLGGCGAEAEGYEVENCDLDDVFFLDADPTERAAAAFSEVTGDQFYDDYTRAQQSVPELTWFQHPNNPEYDDDYVITLSTSVGIGTQTPEATLDVRNDIRIQSGTNEDGTNYGGRLKSDLICDRNNNHCFDPEQITGELERMRCSDVNGGFYGNQAVRRFQSNRVLCTTAQYDELDESINGDALAVDTTIIPSTTTPCAANERVTGIGGSGGVICTNVP